MADAWYGIFTAENHTKLVCMKATTTPSTVTNWSSQDNPIHVWTGAEDIPEAVVADRDQRAGGPGSQDFIKSLWVVQYNDNLHVVTYQESARIAYHVFNTITDVWDIRDETLQLAGSTNYESKRDDTNQGSVSCAMRSNGELVFVGEYEYTSSAINAIRVFTRSVAGTVTNEGEAGVSSAVNARGPICIGPDSSDRITWAFRDVTNADASLKSIDSADTISGVTDIDTSIDTALYVIGSGFIAEDDTIYVPYVDSTDDVTVANWPSSASPTVDITDIAASDRDVAYSAATTPPYPQLVLAGRDNGDRQLLYVDVTDTDIRRNEDTGAGYGADESVTPTITATHLSGNMYDDLLMWFYKSTTLAYDEDTQTAETALATIQGVNASFPAQNSYFGPFLIGGSYYGIFSRNGNDLVAMKATADPPADASFAQTGGRVIVSNDDGHNRYIGSLWAWEAGSDIHVLAQTKAGRVSYSVFDPGTDAWTTQNETVVTPGATDFDQAPTNAVVSGASRADGDVICVARYTDGSGFQRLRCFTREAGVWTNRGAADGAVASTSYVAVSVVGPDSSDRISWAYKDETGDDVDLKSISSTNTLSSATEIDATAEFGKVYIVGRGDINGSNVIYIPYLDSDGHPQEASWTSGASPTPSVVEISAVDANVSLCLALRSNGDRHVTYSDATTDDLWRDVNSGGGYGTDAEIEDAITHILSSCRINEPSAVDLDYFYLDSTTWHFGTVELAAGGGGGINILVTDAVTIGEVAIVYPAGILVLDAVTIGESVTVHILLQPNIEDAITLTEPEARVHIIVQPNIEDAATVGEVINVVIPILIVSVEDAVTVATPTTRVDIQFEINVVDGVTLTETILIAFSFDISVTDAVTIAEPVTRVHILVQPNVFDAVTITEPESRVHILLQPNVEDAVTVAESVQVTFPLFPFAIDDVTIAEPVTRVHVLLQPNIEDAVTVGEVAVVLLPILLVNVEDAVTIASPVTRVHILVQPNVIDAVTITEPFVRVHILLQPNVTDAVTIAEPVTRVHVLLQPLVIDNVTLTEPETRVHILLHPSVTDAVTIGEVVDIDFPFSILVTDAIIVAEAVILDLTIRPSVTDAVTVANPVTRVHILVQPNVVDAVTLTEPETRVHILLQPNVTDAVTIASPVTRVHVLLQPVVEDAVTIGEVTIVALPFLEISAEDAVTIAEPVTRVHILLQPQIIEAVTIAEPITRTHILLQPNIEDAVTVSEPVTRAHILLQPNVEDAVTIGEITLLNLGVIAILVTEGISLTETVALDLTVRPSVTDAVTIASPVTRVHVLLHPNVVDAVTVAEPSPPMDRPVHILLQPIIQEAITIAEPDPRVHILLQPNVTDAVTIAEPVTQVNLGIILINIEDAVTLAEPVTRVHVLLQPNIEDAVTIGETVSRVHILLHPTVEDAVTIAEPITRVHILLQPVVTDAITLSEPITRVHILLQPSVTDAVTIGEAVTIDGLGAAASLTIDIQDAVTVGEVVIMNVLLQPNVTDAVTVAEPVARVHILLQPNVEDAVTVGENVTVYMAFVLNVTDAVTVGEAPILDLTVRPVVEDAITLAEALARVHILLQPVVEDAVTLAEPETRVHVLLQPNVVDAVTLGELTILAPTLRPSVEDAVTVGEVVAVLFPFEIFASDAITVAETATVLHPFILPIVTESIVISELVVLTMPILIINIRDDVTIGETVLFIDLRLFLEIDVSESVTVGELSTFVHFPYTLILLTDETILNATLGSESIQIAVLSEDSVLT